MKNTTKYAVRVDSEKDIKYILQKAYSAATSGRPGPVWIDIPLDIQSKDVNTEMLVGYIDKYVKPTPSELNLSRIISLLMNSKKPVMVLGSGIRLSGAEEPLFRFLEKFKIPAVTGPHSAVDIVNESYEHYCGRIGVLGQRSSNNIIQNCDLMISVGSRLGVKMTGYKFKAFAKNAYKIMVDIDENEMNKYNIHVDLKIKSDCLEFFEGILKSAASLNCSDISEWHTYCKNLRDKEQYVFDKHRTYKGFASNYCFVEGLSELVPEEVPTITSNGSAHVVTLQTMSLKGKQRLFTNVGCASMGYGLPAAIGACVSNDNKKTICIEGDGSLQMNIQELQTVVHHNLPIIIFVINNGLYLSIKRTQENYFDSRYVATNIDSGISSPNLLKIAHAYGIKYISIRSNEEIYEGIVDCLKSHGPIICEVFTNPDEKHEPKVTAILNKDGTFSPGELTDMKIEGV
jgi:acetolactate synthase-1/2/3 large subunit